MLAMLTMRAAAMDATDGLRGYKIPCRYTTALISATPPRRKAPISDLVSRPAETLIYRAGRYIFLSLQTGTHLLDVTQASVYRGPHRAIPEITKISCIPDANAIGSRIIQGDYVFNLISHVRPVS